MTRREQLEVIKVTVADNMDRENVPEVGAAIISLIELLKKDSVSAKVETGS